MALSIGSPAPSFSLLQKTAEGLEQVTLASLREGGSKVVLLFFPLAFTGVCQDELCTISGALETYQSLNAKVVGISVDSPFAQAAFALENNITVPLLSDFNKEVTKAYDVLDDHFLPGKLGFVGVSQRSAFVVGTDGNIAYSWTSEDPGKLPPFDEIKAAL